MRLVLALLLFAPPAWEQATQLLRLETTIELPDVQGRIDHMSADVKGERLCKCPGQRLPSAIHSSYNKGCPDSAIRLLMVESSQPSSYIASVFAEEAPRVIKQKPPFLGGSPWLWPLLRPTS